LVIQIKSLFMMYILNSGKYEQLASIIMSFSTIQLLSPYRMAMLW